MEAKKFTQKSLMLIDDSDIDLFINKRLVEITSFASTISSFNNALGALEEIKNTKNPPDIIFLDINMPLMNGFGFLEKLNAMPEEVRSKLKVVILSSSTLQDDLLSAINANKVDEFISKPLTNHHLQKLESKLFLESGQASRVA